MSPKDFEELHDRNLANQPETARSESATSFDEVVVDQGSKRTENVPVLPPNLQSDEQARTAEAVQTLDTRSKPALGGPELTDKERRHQANAAVLKQAQKIPVHDLEGEVFAANKLES